MPKLYVKAIIFDLDGVITHTMPYHYQSWKAIFKKNGINVSREDIYSREGQRGLLSVREIFAKYNVPYTDKHATRILKRKENHFKKSVKNRFIPGSKSFIKYLHKKNFKLGLVTGTSSHELHKILPRSLYNLFSVIITSNDVKNGKPHPDPYLLALSKLQIKADQAIVIENAPFGIYSAKAAGIRCIALETSLAKEHLLMADIIFKSIDSIRKRINFIYAAQQINYEI